MIGRGEVIRPGWARRSDTLGDGFGLDATLVKRRRSTAAVGPPAGG
jgi:hypothetical protein